MSGEDRNVDAAGVDTGRAEGVSAEHAFFPPWRRAWAAVRGLGTNALHKGTRVLERALQARIWSATWTLCVKVVRRAVPVVRFGTRVSLTALLIAAFVIGSGWFFWRRVPPTTIGVRQSLWGGGIEARDYATGLHFSVRPLDTWYALDARTHLVAFAHRSDGGSSPMLRVRTKDGNVARVAASVPYHIRPEEGHLLVAKGLRSTYRELVLATVKKTLLVELAHLSSKDLASTETRVARVRETLPKLNEELARYHVEAESIELRMVFFPQEYEQTLQKKQLSRQLELLAEAEKDLKDEERRVGRLEMEIEGDVRTLHARKKQAIAEIVARHKKEISPIQAQTATYRETRAAEAQAEYDSLVAEGRIVLDEVEAERTHLLAEAYNSPGGRLYLAREAAHRLRIEEVTLNSNDPDVPSVLDLDELVKLLVGSSESRPPQKSR